MSYFISILPRWRRHARYEPSSTRDRIPGTGVSTSRCRFFPFALIAFVVAALVSPLSPLVATGSTAEKDALNFVGASSNNFPPVNALDPDGNLVGFGRELTDAVIGAVGGTVTHIHSSHWTTVLEWLAGGKADFIHDTGYSEKRKAYLDYTKNPILQMKERIFVDVGQTQIRSFADLSGKTVACVDQHITHIYLKQFPDIRCHVVKRPLDGLIALIQGKAEAFIYPAQIALYLAGTLHLQHNIRIVGEPLRTLNWHMTVKKGNAAMVELLDRGIDRVRASGEYGRIYEKWFGQPRLANYTDRELQLIVGAAIILSLMFAAVIFGWRMRLARNRLASMVDNLVQAEVAKLNSEQRLRRVIDLVPHPIFARDADGRYLLVNRRAAQDHGMTPDEMIGRSLSETHRSKTEIERFMASDKRVLESGETVTIPGQTFLDRQGRTRILQTTKIPFDFDGKGEPAVLGVSVDITEQQQAEEALRESEDRYRNLIEMSPDGIIVSDGERILFANAAAAELLGASSPEELIHRTYEEIIHPDELAEMLNKRSELLATGQTSPITNRRMLRLDGTTVFVDKTPTFISWQGDPAVMVVWRDVAERRRAEETLRESEQRYRSLVEFSPDAILVQEDGKIIYANPAGAALYGAASPDELIGVAMPTLIHPDERAEHSRRRDILVSTTKPLQTTEQRRLRLDQSEILVESRGIPIIWQGKTVILGVSRDITARKKAEDALKESEQQLRLLTDAIPGFITYLGRDQRVRYANKTACQWLDLPAEHVIGAHLRDILSGELYKTVRPQVELALSGKDVSYETEARYGDGVGRTIWAHLAPQIDNDGSVPGYFALVMDITARKRAEDALKESENRYRAVVERSPDGIIVNDKTHVLFANTAAARQHGAEAPDDLIGMLWMDLIAPDERDEARQRYDELVNSSGTIPFFDRQRARLDGPNFVTATGIAPIIWKGMDATLTVFRDATERIEAEQQLRANESQLRQVIDLVPHLIYARDREGKFLLANRATADIYGLSSDELVGRFLSEVDPIKEQYERFHASDKQVIESGAPQQIDQQNLQDFHGRQKIVQTTKVPYNDTSSGRLGILAVSVDISDRVRVEEALRESEERYRSLVEFSPESILVHDGAQIVFANLAVTRLYGYSRPEELHGIDILDFVHLDDRKAYLARLKTIGVTGSPGPINEHRRLRRDGAEILVEARGIPLTWQGKKLYMDVQKDVTAQRRAEEEARTRDAELRRVQRLSTMGELASAIAHEVNQPLTAVMGYSQAGKRLLGSGKPADREEAIELIEKAIKQTERAGAIIRRLRRFIEKRETERGFAELNEAIAEACSFGLADTRNDNVRVEFDLAADLPPIFMDRIQIQQVVINMVRNGLEAMEESDKKELTVCTTLTESGATVTVNDTGSGFDSEVAARLFDPFMSTKTDGMGVGLSISRSIVEAHGGRIWAHDVATGGAEVGFSLPLIDQNESALSA